MVGPRGPWRRTGRRDDSIGRPGGALHDGVVDRLSRGAEGAIRLRDPLPLRLSAHLLLWDRQRRVRGAGGAVAVKSARARSRSSIAATIPFRSADCWSNVSSPRDSRNAGSNSRENRSHRRAVSRNSGVKSTSSTWTNPAARTSSACSRSEETARGPRSTARRWSRFDSPRGTKIVKKAERPPDLSNRRHALSTESLAVSHQRTSVWTTASKVTGRNGRRLAVATTVSDRSARPSERARWLALRMASSGRSVRTTLQPVLFAR